jgi:hypothetical protein
MKMASLRHLDRAQIHALYSKFAQLKLFDHLGVLLEGKFVAPLVSNKHSVFESVLKQSPSQATTHLIGIFASFTCRDDWHNLFQQQFEGVVNFLCLALKLKDVKVTYDVLWCASNLPENQLLVTSELF